LAGSRWTVEPPKDAGLPSWRHEPVYASDSSTVTAGKETHVPSGSSNASDVGRHGYIKISCELFPETQMNLKWCMDALRRLVQESNERATTDGSFTDVPIPTRHMDSQLRSHGLGGGSLKAERKRVTIKDFPKDWLPKQ